jgi:hypothetical protein
MQPEFVFQIREVNIMKNPIAWTFAAVTALFAMTATAADVSLSGFGTLGYAKSNQTYNFERFINNNGTVARDSVVGVQADVKFTDNVGATVQGKFAPSLKSDSTWDSTLSWAFLSWRPSDDLLLRLGKQRTPIYLYSENLDVGVTHDFVRLPTEMYSMSPSTDYIGASISKNWNPSLGELTLDGYVGGYGTTFRTYRRDNIQLPGVSGVPGVNFTSMDVKGGGIALTLQRDEDKYRVSYHKATISLPNPGDLFPVYESLIPASNLAQIDPQLAAIPSGFVSGSVYTVLPQALVKQIGVPAYTFGAEIKLPQDFRLTGEYGRRKVTGAALGTDTSGGYFALLKEVGAWTPYVSCATIKSRSDVLSIYQTINSNTNGLTALIPIPALVGAVAAINSTQRLIAGQLVVYDQNTIALGTSYRLTPKQKIKFEWARTHVGVVSSFVDAPANGNVSNQNINVLSFSYSFVF